MRVGDGYLDLGGHGKECYRSFIEVVALESNSMTRKALGASRDSVVPGAYSIQGDMTHHEILREPG